MATLKITPHAAVTVGDTLHTLSTQAISGVAAGAAQVGHVELATGAETNTGTSATLAVTPDGLDDWTGSAQVATVGALASGSLAAGFTDVPIAQGGTGASTAQAAIDALSAVSGATNEHVLTKDTASGNAIFKVAAAGGGAVATDVIWDAAGDLAIGTGADTAVKLPIGADHTVLVSNGTTASWSAAPPLAAIADTGDTTRITIGTANPHLTLGGNGGVQIEDYLGIQTTPATVPGSGFIRINSTTTDANAIGGYFFPVIDGSTGTNLQVQGVQGTAQNKHTGAGAKAYGLNFESYLWGAGAGAIGIGMRIKPSVVLQSNTVAENTGIRIVTPSAAGNSATITDSHGILIENQSVTGCTQTNLYGIKINDITLGTNVYPLFVAGGSDDHDHYSVHQPNLCLFKAVTAGDDFMGLTTAAKAGDGVLGIGNAATAPDEVTDPTGGLIMWAAAGALYAIGSSGTKTTVAAAEPHCPRCGTDFVLEWKNRKMGHLQVCMWCYGKAGGAGVIKQETVYA